MTAPGGGIAGVGVDRIAIARVTRALERHGRRFVARAFTEAEARQALAKGNPARRFAMLFAAKEAVAKALGTGFRLGIRMCEIGLGHDTLGRPMLRLYGATRVRARESGITGGHVSLSDEREFCIAFVTLVIDDGEALGF